MMTRSEMRSGFRTVEKRIEEWEKEFETFLTADVFAETFPELEDDLLGKTDSIDNCIANFFIKFRENIDLSDFLCLILQRLKECRSTVKRSQSNILSGNADPQKRLQRLRSLDKLENRWEEIINYLRQQKKTLKKVLFQRKLNGELPTEKEEKINIRIAYCLSNLKQHPDYKKMTRQDKIYLIHRKAGCSEDYAGKNIDSTRADYDGKDAKYTTWEYMEETDKEISKRYKLIKERPEKPSSPIL